MTNGTNNPPVRRIGWLAWSGVLVVLAALLLAGLLAQLKLSQAHLKPLPVIGPVAAFTLTNQAGRVVTLTNLLGKVWVADIIFTRCGGPCPRMTQQMKTLQDALPAGSGTQFVTLTTDPDNDNPAVLKAYADKMGADTQRWTFLTGSKKELQALATSSLKLSAVEIKPEARVSPDDFFVHSTTFVVVDKQGRVRGMFETGGEGVDWPAARAKILSAVKHLERES